jgi:uncharacterized coiled-coil DUF342 family protein
MAKDSINFQELQEKYREAAKSEVARLHKEVDQHVNQPQIKKLHAKRDEILVKIQELQAQVQEATQEIREVDYPERFRLNAELTQVAKAAGARGLSDSSV